MSQTPPLLDHLAIIGLGLIGSSIARAVRDYGVARQVTVTDASAQVRTIARDLNLGKVVETSADAVRDADMVILCIPVAQCGSVMAEIERHLKPGAIVSDVGSVKGAVVRDMIPHMPANVHFVPAHPVAGTEQSGPEAGFAELFADRWCILTPPDGTNDSAVKTTTAFWQALGADVEIMPIDHHDQVLAIDPVNMTVTINLINGFSFGKPVWYMSMDTSIPLGAAIEHNTFAPLMAAIHLGGDDTFSSPIERIFISTNGAHDCANPQRQACVRVCCQGRLRDWLCQADRRSDTRP